MLPSIFNIVFQLKSQVFFSGMVYTMGTWIMCHCLPMIDFKSYSEFILIAPKLWEHYNAFRYFTDIITSQVLRSSTMQNKVFSESLNYLSSWDLVGNIFLKQLWLSKLLTSSHNLQVICNKNRPICRRSDPVGGTPGSILILLPGSNVIAGVDL